MQLDGIGKISPITMNDSVSNTQEEKGMDFSSFLKEALNNVNDLQQTAEQSNTLLAAGKIDDLHQVMVDSEKADIALQFTVQVRNKIMDAYNEIMRMQV